LRRLSLPSLPVVIVLAAGLGARFRAAGGLQHKLDAPMGPKTVKQHVMSAVQACDLPWHVVEPEHTAHLHEQGMGTSIAIGVAATANAHGWLILPADLPLIQADTLRCVAQALQTHTVVVPLVNGQRGHPVGFGKVCRDELLALSGDQGAKSVMQRHAAQTLELEDMGCILDVDTPQTLAHAAQIWHSRHPD
jgi:molybdenum cofactor cytidylyltransferase